MDLYQPEFGRSFHEACKNDNLEVVQILLPYIEINSTTQNGFEYAIEKNFVDILDYVLPMNVFDITNSLIIATKNRLPQSTLQLLLNAGASVDITYPNGLTPLMIATIYHNYEQVELLVFYINVNAQSNDGKTALHYSINNHLLSEIFNLLIELSNTNISDNNGFTPFLLAAKENIPEYIIPLAKKSGNINIVNNEGQNALHLILKHPQPSLLIINFLIHIGVDLELEDNLGITPKQLLKESGIII